MDEKDSLLKSTHGPRATQPPLIRRYDVPTSPSSSSLASPTISHAQSVSPVEFSITYVPRHSSAGTSGLGPSAEKRAGKCSKADCFWLVLFALYMSVMVVAGIVSFVQGNPRRLYHGRDTSGFFCGIDNGDNHDFSGRPYVLFFVNGAETGSSLPHAWRTEALPAAARFLGKPERVMRSAAAEHAALAMPSSFVVTAAGVQVGSICVPACPSTSGPASMSSYFCQDGVVPANYTDLTQKITEGLCASGAFASHSDVYRCIPNSLALNFTDPVSGINVTSAQIADLAFNDINESGLFDRVMSDMGHSYPWILLCGLIAMILSLLWLRILMVMAGCIIWTSIFCGQMMLVAMTLFCFLQWHSIDATLTGHSDADNVRSEYTDRDLFLTLAIGFLVATVICSMIVVAMRRRIAFAIVMIRHAANAVSELPQLLVIPIASFLGVVLLFVFNVAVIVHLGSSGKATVHFTAEGTPYLWYDENEALQRLRAFQIIGFIWAVQFLVAFAKTAIAGAVSDWFLSCNNQEVPTQPVLNSVKRAVRYHLGSLAFGSAILVFVWVFRFFLNQLERQLKQSKSSLALFLNSCLECMFRVFERFIAFMSSTAFIQMGITGEPFCEAGMSAFALLARNAIKLVAVDSSSAFIIVLGQVFICLLSTLIGGAILHGAEDLDIFAVPFLVMIFQSFLVASITMALFSTTISTLFLCYCAETDGHEPRASYGPMIRGLEQSLTAISGTNG